MEEDNTPVRTQTVEIPGPWVFQPRVAEVAAGEPVTFFNNGGADHTVTFEEADFDVTLSPGQRASHVFTQPGEYAYVCELHPPDMRGILVVLPKA